MTAPWPPTTPPGPPRPRDLSESQLGFARRAAVRWLAPAQLVRTAVKVVLSKVFGAYDDKRELQGTFEAPLLSCRPDADELWFDFVADLGDGFDATYSVAWTLAQDSLDVPAPDGTRATLPHGAMLVLGGDEVYPTAGARAYEDRTKGPYTAALPGSDDASRLLLALPGNHDWYDGLTAFLRVFCQGRAVGGWRTEQSRSYFAVQLPQRWWLLAVDVSLENYVDAPQLRFFRETVRPLLRPGDGVVVAAPTPAWVGTGQGHPDAFDTLDFLEREVVTGTGAQVRLWVSGDSHHYARFAEVDGHRQLVTCGLGGAYMSATHALPERLTVPSPESRVRQKSPAASYRLESRYPDTATSRRLGKKVWRLPWRNTGFVPLAGGLQAAALVALTLGLSLVEARTPLDALRFASLGAVWTLAGRVTLLAVLAVLVDVVLALALRRRPVTWSPVSSLVAAEVVVALAALAALVSVPLAHGLVGFVQVLGEGALAAALAGAVGAFVFAGWLLVFDGVPAYRGWIFAGQGIEDHKGFLRLHIGRDGALTVHPVVLDRVTRAWRAAPDAPAGSPWVAPSAAQPTPRLVEEPVTIPREG